MNPLQTAILQLALSVAKPLLEKAVSIAITEMEAYYKDSSEKSGPRKKNQVIKRIAKLNSGLNNKEVRAAIGAMIDNEVVKLKQDGRL